MRISHPCPRGQPLTLAVVRWDPNRENLVFLNQSANLYASYYQLQISVHRPFIPSPRKPSPLSFPSLAICTNAARACILALDRHFALQGAPLVNQYHIASLFTAGIILLLHTWGGTRKGTVTDVGKELEYVRKALRVLRFLEDRWNIAGRFWYVSLLKRANWSLTPAQGHPQRPRCHR